MGLAFHRSTRRLRASAMFAIAWLGILMPTVAGVRVDSAQDPVVRAILSSLCLTGDRSGSSQDGSPNGPSSAYQCFFCYPSVNAATGLLTPEAPVLLAIPPVPAAWIVIQPGAPDPRAWHPTRARDPPPALS